MSCLEREKSYPTRLARSLRSPYFILSFFFFRAGRKLVQRRCQLSQIIEEPPGYTAVSTKVVPQKRYSVRDNAEWSYGYKEFGVD